MLRSTTPFTRLMLVLFLFASFTYEYVQAQDLHMPLEFKRAYENGTRSYDGKVTNKYWQNRGVYDLKVSIDPSTKLLSGQGSVRYTNNSPDTLRTIILQAYHNYYKPGSRRSGFFANPDNMAVNDGMVMDKIQVNSTAIDLKNKNQFEPYGTQYVVTLPQPLPTGSSTTVSFEWHYTIPGKGFERSGAIDDSSMFIAYWYPEVAVRDDIHGYDRVTYDASAEFYHDVNDYKVEVTVPESFVVWSSGELKNPSEILPTELYDRYQKAKTSDKKVTIVGKEDLEKGLSMKSSVWKYEIKNVPDFAFALSDHFIWEAGSYQDAMGSFFLHSAYDPKNSGFSTVIDSQKLSLQIFHNDFPKQPFPYDHFTIFNGLTGGGMEFPGMANDQAYSGEQYSKWMGYEVSDFQANLGVTLHEMFHMYFPFMMGINEKRYAWMDEGWADFADYFSPHKFENKNNNEYITRHWTVPMMVPTYTRPNHSWVNSYTIGSYSYYSLYHLLGEELFDECMKTYIERWKGKHPTPYDYFFTFNDASGKDLNWFWKSWYFDFGYPDLSNEGLDDDQLTIKNEGGRPLAFELIYTLNDGSSYKEIISPEVWRSSKVFTKKVPNASNIRSIQLKSGNGSDAIYDNNKWTR